MSKNILLTNHYASEPLEIIQSFVPDGFALMTLDHLDKEELIHKVKFADYILASGRLPVDGEVLSQASKVRMIQRTGVGLDTVDRAALAYYGIPLYVNAGVNAVSVAEHSILLMLSCLRRLPVIHQDTRQGIWQKQKQGLKTHELKGKTVGLIGMGNIGKLVAEMLKGFSVRTIYHSRSRLSPELESQIRAEAVSLEQLLARSDIISLHCPLTAETAQLISEETVRKMKRGVILINTARGKLIDETVLIQALKEGQVRGAGIDVYESEPIAADSELLKLTNVITTPHIGGITYESFGEMMRRALFNIQCFAENRLDLIEKYRYLL